MIDPGKIPEEDKTPLVTEFGQRTFQYDAAKLRSTAIQSWPCHPAFDMGRTARLRAGHLLWAGQSNLDRTEGRFPP